MPGDEVTDRQHRPGRRQVGMKKKFIFALLVTGCFFLVLEILLALAGISPLIDQQDPLVGFAESLP